MRIIETGDGSHTLYSEQFNEIYHSRHGALQESRHVFIEQGLKYMAAQHGSSLNVFEVGFGTGLNAILTYIAAKENNLQVNYTCVELYPVPIETIKELNYSALLENEKYRPPYHSMHLSTWGQAHTIAPHFTFTKLKGSLPEMDLPALNCHVIYFDAFAPEHQPEMWTVPMMQKMYGLLAAGGALVSYCSKSLFQRALKEAGFTVEKIPGPPGKREMVRALKK